MTTGHDFDEVLRVLDSLQMPAEHKVSTPVNWKRGEDVITRARCLTKEPRRPTPRQEGAATLFAHRAPAAVMCLDSASRCAGPPGW
jgi:hypothetical protein